MQQHKERFLIICLSRNGFGGLELQMVAKTKEWIERGHETLLIVHRHSPIHHHAIKTGVPHVAVSQRIEYVDPLTAWQISRVIRSFAPAACLVGITRDLSIALLARSFSIIVKPRIMLFQQMISGLKKRDFFHNWVYRNIDGAIVPAEYMKTMLIESTIIDPRKIEVIPYGIDVNTYRPATAYERADARQLHGFTEHDFVCCIPARYDWLKNQKMCIEAMHRIATTSDNDAIILWCVGDPSDAPDSYYNNMKRLARDLGIEHRVRFSPFTNDFRSILYATDIYLMTSFAETFSLATVQALASGVCSVATRAGGTVEQIHDGINGLLVQSDNSAELADTIIRLYDNPDLRKQLAESAYIEARVRYNADTVYERVILRCLQGEIPTTTD
ncbi:MAG: glycosyltransferase family 4 protein [Candidatus Kapabacteria bacterium]|nr:glycosyltransferase family 4 protein [Candidatus Kapabacteria bacterium]